jgi:adenosylcobinamide kinase / adenosylcobinamide-phosphate guanylyltransferase
MAEVSRPRITFVLGGARSGKSAYAQRLAEDSPGPVLFVATATACDDEMAARIAAHQAARPPDWRTLEAERNVGSAIRASIGSARTVVLDCLSLLVSNLLLDTTEVGPRAVRGVEVRALEELTGLLTATQDAGTRLIVVSNEVGMGLVPETALGRAFRDVLGRANQRMAAAADAVYLMVAGIPMVVKASDRGGEEAPWLA